MKLDDSLITYPCHFPVKVIGANSMEFEQSILAIVKNITTSASPGEIERRVSTTSQYLSITVYPYITSRQQLDALYQALQANPLVKFCI